MSGASQLEMPWDSWLKQAGVEQLWPWQQAALEALAAERSWSATFPAGGGKGLVALLSSLLEGRTLLLSDDKSRLARRLAQAQAAGVPAAIWTADSTPEASLWLVHTPSIPAMAADAATPSAEGESASESTSEGEAAAPTTLPAPLAGAARVLFDMPPATLPAWWSSLTVPRGILSGHTIATGWWQAPDHTTAVGIEPLAAPGPSEGLSSYELQDTPEAPKDWRQKHPEGRVWWHGVPGAQIEAVAVPTEPAQRHAEAETLASPAHNALRLETLTDALASLPAPTHVYFERPPAHLRSLGFAALRGKHVWLHQHEGESNAPLAQDRFSRDLVVLLENIAKTAAAGCVFRSSSELLSALEQPITPQPTFERGAQKLHAALEELRQQGGLHGLNTVHFQIKIFGAQKFTEAAVKDDDDLRPFWQAYQDMKQNLGPMEGLKYSFLNGRTIDLRELCQHLPYTVSQLNHLLQATIDKGLIVGQLEHVFAPERSDQEYELQLGHPQVLSLGMRLWMRSGEHRKALLQAATGHTVLSEETATKLNEFLSNPPDTAAHWQALFALVGPLAPQEQLLPLAGLALAYLDRESSQHALALWLCAHYHLGLPALDKTMMRQALPSPKHAPPEAKPLLAWLLKTDRENFKHYVLDLKDPTGFEEAIALYLEEEQEGLLSRNTSHRARGVLHRFTRLATRSREAAPEAEHPWTAAAAWAAYLQGHKQPAWTLATPLVADAATQPALVQWRLAQIAIGAKEWHSALTLLTPTPAESPLNEEQQESLFRDLHHGLHQICRKSPKDQPCPNAGTAFCPTEANALLALAETRPTLPKEHFSQCVAKRLQHDLAESDTPWLRQVLTEGPGKEVRRIQRLIFNTLAKRDEATAEELELLAGWQERAGKREESYAIRKKLLALQPENALNLHRLAVGAINAGELEQALRWGLDANRAEPQRFPLERFVERNRASCFSDHKALRELLIELPAHPAFRALEEELEALEALVEKLKPFQEKAEAAIAAKKYGDAKDIIKPILREHKDKTPAAFEALKTQIVAVESDLLQRIAKIPHRDHKKRNQYLEEVAEEAIKVGFKDIADEAYQKLVKFNPQYGLGFLKLARTAGDPNQRKAAYQKAIDLSKTPQQRQRNLAEYIGSLESEGKQNEILPLLIEIADAFPDEIPKVVAPLMTKLVENLGTNPEISKGVASFIDGLEDPKPFKRAKQALGQMDKLEPWKRALLSIKPG